MHLLAIDPGKTTGLALINYDPEMIQSPRLISTLEHEFNDACEFIENCIILHPADLHVVIERFLITPQTGKNSQAPWSLEVIGHVRRELFRNNQPEFVMQTPQRAKAFATNDRLRKLGFWHKGGGGHANDALRHAIVALVDLGWRPDNLL